MGTDLERRAANAAGIFSLWWNWVIAAGALTTVVVIPVIVPKLWMPLVSFALHVAMLIVIRRRRASGHKSCSLMLMAASHALLWSAIIMVAINTLHTRWLVWLLSDPGLYNRHIPFITVLVVAPVTAIVTLLVKWSGSNRSFCNDCFSRHGSKDERGFLGTLLSREGHYQLSFLLWLSIFTSVYSWIYYFCFYINVNINTPDQFMFRWVPLLLFALSIGYLGMRYVSLWGYYRKVVEVNLERHGDSSWLRFLILSGDYIFLHDPDANNSSDKTEAEEEARTDTPAKLYIPRCRTLSDHEAGKYMAGISGLKAPQVRFMYSSPNFNADCNIFHYACFVDDTADIENTPFTGSWFTLDQVKRLDGAGRLSPYLASELGRLYRVAMAWKTYDRDGRRLYSIKNYRPTFRLRDFKKWEVDIDDPVWLFVSDNNEDRPFYHIKRLWRRYVNGIGK